MMGRMYLLRIGVESLRLWSEGDVGYFWNLHDDVSLADC